MPCHGRRTPRPRRLLQGWDEFRQLWRWGQESARPLPDCPGIRFLFSDDDAFPRRLARMPEVLRPHWIFVAGNGLLERPSLAIVGTRDASETGSFLSRYAVSCAAELGAPVVSGLAHRIDRLVHEWCHHVSLPTISVLGTEILVNYPARHAPLSEAILAAGGALVGEYLPDQEPSGQPFVWRNRLQAALGCATIRSDGSEIGNRAYGPLLEDARASGFWITRSDWRSARGGCRKGRPKISWFRPSTASLMRFASICSPLPPNPNNAKEYSSISVPKCH